MRFEITEQASLLGWKQLRDRNHDRLGSFVVPDPGAICALGQDYEWLAEGYRDLRSPRPFRPLGQALAGPRQADRKDGAPSLLSDEPGTRLWLRENP
jgi:hypothetical protein